MMTRWGDGMGEPPPVRDVTNAAVVADDSIASLFAASQTEDG
ncbi:hypothetical protein [Nonomuraea sp. NPDC049400]